MFTHITNNKSLEITDLALAETLDNQQVISPLIDRDFSINQYLYVAIYSFIEHTIAYWQPTI